MAVLTLSSDQTAAPSGQQSNQVRNLPIESYGKMRSSRFSITLAAQADVTSTIDLVRLPSGRVRVLPYASKFWTSAWGAGATLSIGHRSYTGSDGVAVAADPVAFMAATSVAAVNSNTPFDQTKDKFDLFSRDGVTVYGVVGGANAPAAATLKGYVHFITE